MELNKMYQGDALSILRTFPDDSIDCFITSPPYWGLRDYNTDGQIGLETTFQEYINNLCNIFDEVRRTLKKEGTCWVNIGDVYSGGDGSNHNGSSGSVKQKKGINTERNIQLNHILPDKCLCQIPSRFAVEMTNRGWILRNEIIWYKPNAMPSSAIDRFTVDFEKIFFFTKSKKYYFEQQLEPYTSPVNRWSGELTKGYKGKFTGTDGEKFGSPRARNTRLGANTGENNKPPYKNNNPHLIRINYPERERSLRPTEEGKNKRCIWAINTKPYQNAHFATFPEQLIAPMIKAGCPENGIVCDPFGGAGTTGLVAKKFCRNYILIELNPVYIIMAEDRINEILL